MALEDPRYGSLFAAIFLFFIPTSILGMISPYAFGSWFRMKRTAGRWRVYSTLFLRWEARRNPRDQFLFRALVRGQSNFMGCYLYPLAGWLGGTCGALLWGG